MEYTYKQIAREGAAALNCIGDCGFKEDTGMWKEGNLMDRVIGEYYCNNSDIDMA